MEWERRESELHKLRASRFGAEPFLGSDQEPSKLGQLFESLFNDSVGKFVRDGVIPRLAFAKGTERDARES